MVRISHFLFLSTGRCTSEIDRRLTLNPYLELFQRGLKPQLCHPEKGHRLSGTTIHNMTKYSIIVTELSFGWHTNIV